MYKCEICNREFTMNSSYIQHLNHEIKNGCMLHKQPLLDYYTTKIKRIFPHLEVLNITYKKGRPYAQIFNNKCGHSSLLRVDHITDSHRACSHPECVSMIKSKASLGKKKSELHRLHIREAQNRPEVRNKMSETLKIVLNKPDVKARHLKGIYDAREKHANGIAAWQRNKASADELYVKQYFEKYNIPFVYQYPFVTDEFEFIIDFYIPDKNIFIQVNTDPYHHLDESSTSKEYKSRAAHTIQKDKQLFDLFTSTNIGKLFQITDLSQLEDILNYYGGENNVQRFCD